MLVFANELGGMLAPVFRMLVVGVLVRMGVNRTVIMTMFVLVLVLDMLVRLSVNDSP